VTSVLGLTQSESRAQMSAAQPSPTVVVRQRHARRFFSTAARVTEPARAQAEATPPAARPWSPMVSAERAASETDAPMHVSETTTVRVRLACARS
jgi:hypothetical protein